VATGSESLWAPDGFTVFSEEDSPSGSMQIRETTGEQHGRVHRSHSLRYSMIDDAVLDDSSCSSVS